MSGVHRGTSMGSANMTVGERGAQEVPCRALYSASSSSYVINIAFLGAARGETEADTGASDWRRAAWACARAAFFCRKRA